MWHWLWIQGAEARKVANKRLVEAENQKGN